MTLSVALGISRHHISEIRRDHGQLSPYYKRSGPTKNLPSIDAVPPLARTSARPRRNRKIDYLLENSTLRAENARLKSLPPVITYTRIGYWRALWRALCGSALHDITPVVL